MVEHCEHGRLKAILEASNFSTSAKELVGQLGGRQAEGYRTGRRLRIASALVLQGSYE